MDLAKRLGVEDLDAPLMASARRAWQRWCADDPGLGVVAELDELPEWTRRAPRASKADVLGHLAALTATDAEAVTVLAWLLVPGATRIAVEFGDLHPDVDGLVSGQLWLEASRAHELAGPGVARAILRRTRSEVMAELGVGDAGRRHDRVWAESTHLDPDYDVRIGDDPLEFGADPFWEVTGLMIEAMDANAIHVFDAWLLGELARLAAQLGVASHRGRSGLTTPAVIDLLAETVHLSSRAIRRRATTALDRWGEFLRVRDDPDAYPAWRAHHRGCTVTPSEEMQLVLNEDGPAEFFRAQDLPADAWAPDVPPARRRSATA